MLKIKDNVDLKELEKYQLKASYHLLNNESPEVEVWCLTRQYSNGGGQIMFQTKDDSENKLVYYGQYNLDILFDLIKAGLVEKVDDSQ